MIKPQYTLFVLLTVGLLCLIAMVAIPERGLKFGSEFTLKFARIEDFLSTNSGDALDVKELLTNYEADSAAVEDSVKRQATALRQKMLRLQYPVKYPHLEKFFQALVDLKAGRRSKIRILHYGDSQIEGDRITSYVREKLQAEFGGNGPGMLPLFEFVPNFSVQQSQSSNWIRYTAFGRRDSTVKHNNFGLTTTFSRFTPYRSDSLLEYQEPLTASVTYEPSKYGYSRVKRYTRMRLSYGNFRKPVLMDIKINGEIVQSDSLQPIKSSAIYEYYFSETPARLTLEFTGSDSPDFYGLSLESPTGIAVDNIAMRGGSGTVFTRLGASHFASQIQREPVSLIIMQFGGNTVPHIKNQKNADDYGKWFASQIAFLKRIVPEADILVIGPSDMSVKENTSYVTYPFLVEVRDALKKAAFAEGAAFWDIFEVMGGKNSMPSWVDADPPLAGPDYIHFTPLGAKTIAELFYKAMHQDYNIYLSKKASAIPADTTSKE